MLPGMGGFEIIVLALLALVVVGPKDLPILLRRLGKMTAKVRNMADEFRASFDELARQSELDELRQQVESLRAERLHEPFKEEIEGSFRDINHSLTGTRPYAYPPEGEVYNPQTNPDNAPVMTRLPQVSATPAKPARKRALKPPAKSPPVKTPPAKKPAARKPAAKTPASKAPAAKAARPTTPRGKKTP